MRALRTSVVVCVVLGLVAAAQAATIPTRWSEHARVDGKVAMTFNTRAITITGTTWAVAGSLKNNTSRPIRVLVQEPGIAIADTPPKRGQEYRFIKARTVSPAFPSVLAPGQVWRGTFRGGSIPAGGAYLMVVYGDFERLGPSMPRRWQWVTDHALRR
jgi:hypothetical protein